MHLNGGLGCLADLAPSSSFGVSVLLADDLCSIEVEDSYRRVIVCFDHKGDQFVQAYTLKLSVLPAAFLFLLVHFLLIIVMTCDLSGGVILQLVVFDVVRCILTLHSMLECVYCYCILHWKLGVV